MPSELTATHLKRYYSCTNLKKQPRPAQIFVKEATNMYEIWDGTTLIMLELILILWKKASIVYT